ncbi:MAG: chromosome segregation protein SMC [Candidatus Gastranaerophilales bacterium]|nr:chromosome segregation protein SMC [Candidatus Gastranaerophilales bacterium]
MYIKEIEIDNFKSFANKITVPLLQGFTAISGPNGSGKSNIIDSILFALGLTSARTLRSEQGVADLITSHNKRNEASVKVTFAMDENNEFSIKRYIKKGKNGVQSNYFYNDKPATLTQIHLELEKYNISPNSYNVMMQGDVTEITKCSAIERRKIIDEIAGTADFDRKINLATEQIQSVEDRVASANIIINELDIQIEQLKQDREVALKYQKLKDEKAGLETQIQSAKYFDTIRSLELVHQNILTATKEKKELIERLKETESKIKDTQIKYDEVNSKVKAQGEERQLEVKKLAEEKKGEIERKKSAIALAEKTTIDNLKQIENYKNGIKVQEDKIKEFELSIKEKTQNLDKLNKDLKEKKDTLDKIIQEMTGLNKSADEHIQSRNKLRHELDELKDDENKIIKEQLPLESNYKNNEEKIKSTVQQLEKLKNSARIFDDEKDKLTLQIKQLENETADFKILQTKTFEELDKTRNQKEDTLYKVQQATNRIAVLEANKNAYKTAGMGSGIETVLNAHIQGVHEPLAQLADVEGEYIDAINVAMGARAYSIVVDNQDVAYRAIQVLRSQGRDRASFIPLDIIKKAPNRMALPKGQGIIDFAINLIDFDDKYIDAFYFALGETIVVEDETSAKKLAGKYRVVTLEGDITEKSGLITGGAKKRASNMFDKSQERELEKHKKLLASLKNEAQNLLSKEKEYEKKLDDIRQKNSTALNALNSAKLELKNLISNNETSANSIKEGEELLKTLKEENKKISHSLDLIENKFIKLTEKMTSVQEELEAVEKLIDEGELKKLKEKTQSTEDEIKNIEKAIMVAQNDIERDENQIKFQKNTISTRENDIKKLTNDNEILKTDIEKFNSEILIVQKELEELEEQIKELGKNLIELQKKRDEFQDELVNLKTSKNKVNDNLERLSEQEESYKARRKELEPILENIIKEFETAGINYKDLEKTEISLDEINTKIARLQKRMEELEPVNMRAITQYDSVMERQSENKQKVETLENEKNEIKTRMNGYQNLKKETFLDAYHAINKNFKEVFAQISEGEGTLVLENEIDPFSGGLTFAANIRDKKNQKLAGMSGGEKSLTALAFVFAIQKYLPSPFYAFDEVDMHLDGPNVERLANIITNQAKTAQFIVVSLRKPMLDNADRMIGVTQKDKGVTKISGVKLKDE